MYEVETIELDEDHRLKVYHDDTTESPLDWGWDVEMHEIDGYDIWRGRSTPETPEAQAARRFYKTFPGDYDKRDRAMRLWLNARGDERKFKIEYYHGYVQSDWAIVLVIGDEDAFGLYEVYEQWRRGDVFGVVLEEKKRYTFESDPLDYVDEWEETESLWGCYLNDDYTAEQVAQEYFDVSDVKA